MVGQRAGVLDDLDGELHFLPLPPLVQVSHSGVRTETEPQTPFAAEVFRLRIPDAGKHSRPSPGHQQLLTVWLENDAIDPRAEEECEVVGGSREPDGANHLSGNILNRITCQTLSDSRQGGIRVPLIITASLFCRG
ncbi:hypothetical protein ACFVYD_27245 [Streptomyces sp. NPDC058301]|uniref:hypothetical protein n=1 Tax=Streptomyces sp. NPDC058301 TaxID=3346436 RepID=UPI0036E5BB28